MELTKHAHACVTLESDGDGLVIDPGTFTPNAAELVAGTATILVTHEHFDHFDEALIAGALQARPDLKVYGPPAVVDRWSARPGQVVPVADGDQFTAAGFDIAVFGELHASIHRDVPQVANVGYLVGHRLYHPGDAYFVPPAKVTTLLLPTSGPWTKLGDAVDYVRTVGPERVVQIHELMLSEVGQRSTAMFLSPEMLTDVPLMIVAVGDSITV